MPATPESKRSPGAGLHGAAIRHLAAFVAVAREGSFRAAAKRLGAGQSTLSQRVARLESAVGARLLVRSPGAVDARLTDAGRLTFAHAEAVLARVEAARADLAAIGGSRPLRVGVNDAIATGVLPTILRRLDGIPIESREAREDGELLEEVDRGSVDLTFAALPLAPGPFEWEAVLEEPYVLLVPARWAVVQGPAPLGEIEQGSLPLVCHSGPRGDEIAARLRARDRPVRIVRRAESDCGVRALVGAGVGAAILPRLSVDPADPATVAIDVGAAFGGRIVALAWHRFRRPSAPAVRFRQVAGAVCAGLARDWQAVVPLDGAG